jgi:hypothetical protein
MSVKSRILPMLVLTATMGISACVTHVREPYGYYGGGYRAGYTRVHSDYPRRTVYRHDHDRRYSDRDRWRRDDRRYDNDRDNDGIHDRYDRHD